MRRAVTAGAVVAGLASSIAASAAHASVPPRGGAPALEVFIENAHGQRVSGTFTGERLHIVAIVAQYVPGQQVAIRIDRDGRRVLRAAVTPQPVGDGRGRATVEYRSPRPGTLLVRATHFATPQQGRLDAAPRDAVVAAMHADPGSRGYAVWALQHDLSTLGYAVFVSGRYDDATARAVVAYQKVTGLSPTGVATSQLFRLLLRGHGLFHVRYRNHGRHFEADLTHQVLAEIDAGGRVRQIYEMSSGKPSTPTVVGTFHIYEKDLGTNAKGMVDANYFIRGYAIHGYADVPTYAASHGCLRIPIPDAAAVFSWARIGEIVDVYDRNGGGSHRVRGNAGP